MSFDSIHVIGEGRLAKTCAKIASKEYDLEAILVKQGNLDEYFARLQNALIISANNLYLFKASSLRKNTVINYHPSLLPAHPGLNAHIWAVYERDLQAGITWHMVDEGIDTGKILYQEGFALDPKTSACELFIKQIKLGEQCFIKALHNLNQASFSQNISLFKARKRSMLPNDGELDLSKSFENIQALLLSMDTGVFMKLAPLKARLLGSEKRLSFYELCSNSIKLYFECGTQIIINKKEEK